jgi:hypothetical protein
MYSIRKPLTKQKICDSNKFTLFMTVSKHLAYDMENRNNKSK